MARERTIKDVLNTFTCEQLELLYFMVGEALGARRRARMPFDHRPTYLQLNHDQKLVFGYIISDAEEKTLDKWERALFY